MSNRRLASKLADRTHGHGPAQHSRHDRPAQTDRRIDTLLALLADNAMIVISGAKIAREIGVTRSTVWRWTEKLRSLGVKVKGHPRTGYQIERVPDVLAPNMLRRRLYNSVFSKRIYHFFKVDSTNTVALRLGHEGEPHGAVILAEEQTAGRGRVGRSWHSEKTSGIYLTVLLRPPIMHAEPDRINFVIVGIGLNINHTHMPEELEPIATSLRMATGRVHSRLELLVKLLRSLERYYNLFLAESAAPILARFAEVSSYARGKRVRISTATETYVGTTAGLEPNGLLRVERDDGRTQVVISGDVAEAP